MIIIWYIYMYIYMYIYVYIYVYICIYIYTWWVPAIHRFLKSINLCLKQPTNLKASVETEQAPSILPSGHFSHSYGSCGPLIFTDICPSKRIIFQNHHMVNDHLRHFETWSSLWKWPRPKNGVATCPHSIVFAKPNSIAPRANMPVQCF